MKSPGSQADNLSLENSWIMGWELLMEDSPSTAMRKSSAPARAISLAWFARDCPVSELKVPHGNSLSCASQSVPLTSPTWVRLLNPPEQRFLQALTERLAMDHAHVTLKDWPSMCPNFLPRPAPSPSPSFFPSGHICSPLHLSQPQ